MKRLLPALGLAFAAASFATSATATTISVTVFDPGVFATQTGVTGAVVEDFENLDTSLIGFETGTPRSAGTTGEFFGEIHDDISTSVGTFTTVGGVGSGSTCGGLTLGGDRHCDNIALQFDPDLNGQGNVVPDDGQWALNANDTLGIIWDAALPRDQAFDTLIFVLRDAADVGRTLTVTAEDGSTMSVDTETLSGLNNDNIQLFVVTFGTATTSATVTLTNSGVNDSFTLDGATLIAAGGGGTGNNNPPVVPLPAGAWLLLGGLGALAVARRRRDRA